MKNAIAEMFRKQAVEQAAEYSAKAKSTSISQLRDHYLDMAQFHSELAFKWGLAAN